MRSGETKAIMIGSIIGGCARYGMDLLFAGWSAGPYSILQATLACNLIGCLVIGLAAAWIFHHTSHRWHAWVKYGLVTGLCGSFTTFSLFSAQLFQLLEEGKWGLAASYWGITLVGGLGLTALAQHFALPLLGRRQASEIIREE
jgi:CrcB protein